MKNETTRKAVEEQLRIKEELKKKIEKFFIIYLNKIIFNLELTIIMNQMKTVVMKVKVIMNKKNWRSNLKKYLLFLK